MCYTIENTHSGGVLPLKKYFGYLVAALSFLLYLGMTALAKRYGALLDSFYPYVTRWVQRVLSRISSIVPFTLWQVGIVLMALGLIVGIALVIWKKKSLIRFIGWALAIVSLGWTTHTAIYGLNYYASSLSQDIRMEEAELTQQDLENALTYFRDQANALALQLPRDGEGNLIYDDFDVLGEHAYDGYKALTLQGYSVFAGSDAPVKKLSWSKFYTSSGICGMSVALTGEAAVNPRIPNMSLPFTMCHEMAHRMCIVLEDDANFAAFLACRANEDPQFQYSAYYMAYRYCFNALARADQQALHPIHAGVNDLFRKDLNFYDAFFTKEKNETATNVTSATNNAYIQVSGDKNGIASYGMVATQLTRWYLQYVENLNTQEQNKFDPLDKDYISGILGD